MGWPLVDVNGMVAGVKVALLLVTGAMAALCCDPGTPSVKGAVKVAQIVGAELLVYARMSPQTSSTGYMIPAGSRTALVQDAQQDLRTLGRGRPPTVCVVRQPGRTR